MVRTRDGFYGSQTVERSGPNRIEEPTCVCVIMVLFHDTQRQGRRQEFGGPMEFIYLFLLFLLVLPHRPNFSPLYGAHA